LENKPEENYIAKFNREKLLWKDFFAIDESGKEREKIEEIKKKMPQSNSPRTQDLEAKKLFYRSEKEKMNQVEWGMLLYNSKEREPIKKRMEDIINAVNEKGIQEMVFLDKGARLWGYYFSKSWDILKPEKEKPRVSFINIGKEKTNDVNPENAKVLQKELLKTFGDKFEDKKICIFDEYLDSGASLVLTTVLFEKTYPSSEIYSEWLGCSSLDRSYFEKVKKDVHPLTDSVPVDSRIIKALYTTSKGVEDDKNNPGSILAKSWTESDEKYGYKDNLANSVHKWRGQFKKLALEFLDEEN
jgi:hypothetical protein